MSNHDHSFVIALNFFTNTILALPSPSKFTHFGTISRGHFTPRPHLRFLIENGVHKLCLSCAEVCSQFYILCFPSYEQKFVGVMKQ